MKTRSAWFIKFLSCENRVRGSADPAAADFMRKSTTVRFRLFHRCANFFSTGFRKWFFYLSVFVSTIWRFLAFEDLTRSQQDVHRLKNILIYNNNILTKMQCYIKMYFILTLFVKLASVTIDKGLWTIPNRFVIGKKWFHFGSLSEFHSLNILTRKLRSPIVWQWD